MPQVLSGVVIFCLGLTAMAGLVPFLADYTYPIVWWGMLLIVDAWIDRRRGLSLWRRQLPHFVLVTIPISVLFWLLFEGMNLPAPQWRYKGGVDSLHAEVLFGFIAFATVIPIMVESYWLVAGEFCLPQALLAAFRKHRIFSILLGVAFAAIPFFNDVFWFNQGIWLAPALVLLPFAKIRRCAHPRRFAAGLIVSGVMAGFFWELFNYWARTHWEYLILPGAPHLFQMPLPGYIGFIPFALTSLVVYEHQLRLSSRIVTSALLYSGSVAVLYMLTTVYQQRGLWVVK